MFEWKQPTCYNIIYAYCGNLYQRSAKIIHPVLFYNSLSAHKLLHKLCSRAWSFIYIIHILQTRVSTPQDMNSNSGLLWAHKYSFEDYWSVYFEICTKMGRGKGSDPPQPPTHTHPSLTPIPYPPELLTNHLHSSLTHTNSLPTTTNHYQPLTLISQSHQLITYHKYPLTLIHHT